MHQEYCRCGEELHVHHGAVTMCLHCDRGGHPKGQIIDCARCRQLVAGGA